MSIHLGYRFYGHWPKYGMIHSGPTYELYVDYFQTSRFGFKKIIFIPYPLLIRQNRLIDTRGGGGSTMYITMHSVYIAIMLAKILLNFTTGLYILPKPMVLLRSL